jgi:hypothetical protein
MEMGRKLSVKINRWRGLKLLSTLIISLLLVNPVFAQTDTARITDLEKEVSQMVANRTMPDGLRVHGFLDIGYASNNYEDVAVKLHGFNVGLLDLYLTPEFSDNVKSLVELVFEVDAHGAVVVDFERAQVGYTFNDKVTLWGGRFHTPYGYWNTAFHNGAQIQTSVLRPRFLAFGDRGGVLPAHMVGLWATGKTGAGEGKITYDVFAGNGSKFINVTGTGSGTGTVDTNVAGDNNHNVMLGLNVGYEFSDALEGLRLAAHGFKGTIDAYSGDATTNGTLVDSTDLNMLGGSVVYLVNDWEVMSEYYHFDDQDKIGATGSHTSWASYLQVGKTFNKITPFVHYFGDQETGRAYSRQSIGMSYSLNPKANLKLELLHSKFEADAVRGSGGYNSVLAQYAIRF